MSRKKLREKRQAKKEARRRTWIIGSISVVATVLILAYFLLAQDQPGTKFADQGNTHLEAEPTNYIWNSRPPTSGPHRESITAWGIYTEPVAEWVQVHNLEDGGVILHYNCPQGCPDVVEQLTDIVERNGEDRLILHPYPNMDSRIAVTAWTRMITMEDVDVDAIQEFIDAYKGADHHRAGSS